jgi:hypothetical protein
LKPLEENWSTSTTETVNSSPTARMQQTKKMKSKEPIKNSNPS